MSQICGFKKKNDPQDMFPLTRDKNGPSIKNKTKAPQPSGILQYKYFAKSDVATIKKLILKTRPMSPNHSLQYTCMYTAKVGLGMHM